MSLSLISKQLNDKFLFFKEIDSPKHNIKILTDISKKVKNKNPYNFKNKNLNEKNIIINPNLSVSIIKTKIKEIPDHTLNGSILPVDNKTSKDNFFPSKTFASNMNSSKNVFGRLYDEKATLVERRKSFREDNDNFWKTNMFKPKISGNAMKISRDPNKFHERLHNSKKKVVETVINKTTNEMKEYSSRSTNFNSQRNSTPNLKLSNSKQNLIENCNDNNLKINNSFKSKHSKSNLLLPSKNVNSSKDLLNRDKISANKFTNESNRNRSNSYTKESCIRISQNIYEKGLVMNKKKEEEVAKRIKENSEKEKMFTFKPDTSKSQFCRLSNMSDNSIRRSNSDIYVDFMKRNNYWNVHKEKVKAQLREESKSKDKEKNIFRPNTNKEILNDDEEFILKHIDHTNRYVNSRRSFIRVKNLENERNDSKACYCTTQRFNVSSRHFTNNPIHKYTKVNHVKSNLCEIRKLSPLKILDLRKELRTASFFSDECVELNNKEFELELKNLSKNLDK